MMISNKLTKYTKEYYEYTELCRLFKEVFGRDDRDWAGKYKDSPTPEDYLTGNFPEATFAKSKGYNWEVLNNNSDGSIRCKEELDLRVKIHEEYELVQDKYEKPYQDFWHYAMDHIFYNVSNGSFHTFNPRETLEYIGDENPGEYEFVKEVLQHFTNLFIQLGLPEEIEVCISW